MPKRKSGLPTDEDIAKVRDAYLAAYVRRNPGAVPHPGTSLYAVLEAAALVVTPLFMSNPDALPMLEEMLAEDEAEAIRPAPVEAVYDPDGRGEPQIQPIEGARYVQPGALTAEELDADPSVREWP